MSDWLRFTEEVLRVWPDVKLAETRDQLRERLQADVRYENNRDDIQKKLHMVEFEIAMRRAYP